MCKVQKIGFTAADMGLFSSLYSIGIFVGAMFGGKIGDVLGRTVIFRLAPIIIAAISIALFFTSEPMLIIAARLCIGLLIGADYPGASTIVALQAATLIELKGLECGNPVLADLQKKIIEIVPIYTSAQYFIPMNEAIYRLLFGKESKM